MLRGRGKPTPARAADNDGQLRVPPEHILHLGHLIDDLIHGHIKEIAEHNLGDGLEARSRGSDGGPDNGAFGDRRVSHSLWPVLRQQPLRYRKRSSEQAHVLAEEDGSFVRGENVVERGIQSFPNGHRTQCFSARNCRLGISRFWWSQGVHIREHILGLRLGTRAGKGDRLIHLVLNVVTNPGELILFNPRLLMDSLSKGSNAVTLPPTRNLFLGAIWLRVALPVSAIAVGLAFNESGAVTLPRRGYGVANFVIHVQDIGAIGDDTRHGRSE